MIARNFCTAWVSDLACGILANPIHPWAVRHHGGTAGITRFAVVRRGSQWFAVVRRGSPWFAVVRRGSPWFAVVRSGSRCAGPRVSFAMLDDSDHDAVVNAALPLGPGGVMKIRFSVLVLTGFEFGYLKSSQGSGRAFGRSASSEGDRVASTTWHGTLVWRGQSCAGLARRSVADRPIS